MWGPSTDISARHIEYQWVNTENTHLKIDWIRWKGRGCDGTCNQYHFKSVLATKCDRPALLMIGYRTVYAAFSHKGFIPVIKKCDDQTTSPPNVGDIWDFSSLNHHHRGARYDYQFSCVLGQSHKLHNQAPHYFNDNLEQLSVIFLKWLKKWSRKRGNLSFGTSTTCIQNASSAGIS